MASKDIDAVINQLEQVKGRRKTYEHLRRQNATRPKHDTNKPRGTGRMAEHERLSVKIKKERDRMKKALREGVDVATVKMYNKFQIMSRKDEEKSDTLSEYMFHDAETRAKASHLLCADTVEKWE